MSGWNSLKQTRLYRMIFVCVFLVILIVMNPRHMFSPLQATVGFIASPFERVFSGLGFYISSSLDFVTSIGGLKNENTRLTQENIRLIAENAKLTDMQKENDFLRQQVELLPRGTFILKAAEIIAMDQKSVGNTITLGKGSSQGVRQGMVVIVNDGVLVGRVSDVSLYTSQVTLITSPESVINANDASTEARGVLRGRYGVSTIFDTVLQSEELKQGDTIITSGLGGDFPRGLLLGKVDSVYPSSDHLFQEATIIPAIQFSQLKTVFLIE